MSNNCQALENSQRRLEAMDIGFHCMMPKPGKLHSLEKLAYGKRLIFSYYDNFFLNHDTCTKYVNYMNTETL